MTSEIGWASLGIVPTLDRGFDSKLSRGLDPALSRVGSTSGKRFGGILGKAAVAGAAGIIGAGFAAISLAKSSLAEAREAQEVGATTAAILKSTGGAAKVTKREYDALTRTLMHKTAIDDEQIATGGNLLLTFKNVKREGKGLKDIFGRALASSLDLTAAGFGSIDSTSKQLGKALNDPIKGISALGRAGVTFTADQQETIKSLVETGDLLGAQKIILKEVESQVGGTAEAQKTSAKELEVAWGNLKEELGGALIPVMDDLADVLNRKAIPAGHDLSDWLKKDGIPQVKDFAKKAEPLARELLPAIGTAAGDIRDGLSAAAPYAKSMVDAFNDAPDWVQKGTVFAALGALAGKKFGLFSALGGGKSGGGLLGLVTKAKPLPVLVVNPGFGGSDIPGVPGKGPKGAPKIPKALLAGAYIAPFAAVGIGAEAMAQFLGSRPAASDPERAKRYSDTISADDFRHEFKKTPFTTTIDPNTGRLTLRLNVDAKSYDETASQLEDLRERAARPIKVPVQLVVDDQGLTHSVLGGHEAPVPGESPTSGRRVGGITIHGGMHVQAHDYRDFQHQAQRRMQQAALGAVGAF